MSMSLDERRSGNGYVDLKLLHVDSSIQGEKSISRQLSARIVERYSQIAPGLYVTYRDLAALPPPHITGEFLAQRDATKLSHLNPALRVDVENSRHIIEEFLTADIVVIGAPMYNFSIPSQLKAWIDRLAVAGKSFRYTHEGSVGLAGGKKLIVASSRGGYYGQETVQHVLDHQETYLRAIFGFFGVADIVFVRAEGTALSSITCSEVLEVAIRQIEMLTY